MAYEIIQKFISKNRSKVALQAKGTVVHETATPGASDEAEQHYFDSAYRGVSAHAFVDCDSITQCIPWNEKARHAGPIANSSFLSVELCHYDDEAKFNEVYKRAVWLFAWLHVNVLHAVKITPDNLMSHAEVSARWHETNHQDPVVYFAQFGKSVEGFRADVQAAITDMIAPKAEVKAAVDDNVLRLQQNLNRLKIHDGKGNVLKEDGILGNCTKEAVKRFQSIVGLEVDGVAGSEVLSAIDVILKKPYCSINIKPSRVVVRYIQFRAGASYDGAWGTLTDKAVADWQRKNGLIDDSKVGANTWNRLIG